jgi:hypothetical protein
MKKIASLIFALGLLFVGVQNTFAVTTIKEVNLGKDKTGIYHTATWAKAASVYLQKLGQSDSPEDLMTASEDQTLASMPVGTTFESMSGSKGKIYIGKDKEGYKAGEDLSGYVLPLKSGATSFVFRKCGNVTPPQIPTPTPAPTPEPPAVKQPEPPVIKQSRIGFETDATASDSRHAELRNAFAGVRYQLSDSVTLVGGFGAQGGYKVTETTVCQ